ncbi:RPE-retinal G protein-coupled receptor-like isoform X1 [Clavelina lepadiformis]|uniref:RPE-retinal G protein-coupled receptor-like isoform X1 n=1 Tax=Clavelina lepadiformis TaxID=159417 RepID=UPI004041097E
MELHDSTIRTIFGALMFLIAATSMAGYAIYGLAIWNRKKLQQKTIWVTSLAMADILMTFQFIVVAVASLRSTWPFGNFECQVSALISLAGGFVAIASITWIAIDRYYQACKPEKFGVNYGFFLGCVWSLSLLAAALPAFGFGSYEHASKDTVVCLLDLDDGKANRGYVMTVALIWFVYPVVKMFLYYHKLAQESKSPHLVTRLVPAIFLLCYTPYALFAALQVTIGLGSVPVWISVAVHLLPKLLSAINPYIYMQSDPELLQACKDVISWKSEEKKEK